MKWLSFTMKVAVFFHANTHTHISCDFIFSAHLKGTLVSPRTWIQCKFCGCIAKCLLRTMWDFPPVLHHNSANKQQNIDSLSRKLNGISENNSPEFPQDQIATQILWSFVLRLLWHFLMKFASCRSFVYVRQSVLTNTELLHRKFDEINKTILFAGIGSYQLRSTLPEK